MISFLKIKYKNNDIQMRKCRNGEKNKGKQYYKHKLFGGKKLVLRKQKNKMNPFHAFCVEKRKYKLR